jgi:hypothetical protein
LYIPARSNWHVFAVLYEGISGMYFLFDRGAWPDSRSSGATSGWAYHGPQSLGPQKRENWEGANIHSYKPMYEDRVDPTSVQDEKGHALRLCGGTNFVNSPQGEMEVKSVVFDGWFHVHFNEPLVLSTY